LYVPAFSTGEVETPQQTAAELAGTVSSSQLDSQEQARLAAAREAYEHEQQEKERVAREELARQEEERRRTEEERERARKEKEEERLRREQKEREERERIQEEERARVERLRELEERLTRLATSMPPPPPAAVGTETTPVQPGITTAAVSNNSFPGTAPETLYERAAPSPQALPAAAKPKSNSLLLIGAAVVLVVVVGGIIAAYVLLRPKGTTPGGPGATPTPAASPAADNAVKPDLVEIPAGTFQMGRNEGPPQETPTHQVSVNSFFMDKTEVTNKEYAEFVRDTHHAPPSDWNGTKPPYGTELWPVLNVSIDDVNAFAAWRSKRDGVTYRLPTEEEWEYAARNGEGNDLYPWGNTWKDNQAVLREATPTKVGSHPEGNNKWGVSDLIGNVWEWTSTKTNAYPGNRTPIPTALKNWNVIRGGGFDRDPSDRDNPVSSCIRTFVSPESKIPQLGFRLVR
jgi:formylglycine-generating enzyme required for sulfatase activity